VIAAAGGLHSFVKKPSNNPGISERAFRQKALLTFWKKLTRPVPVNAGRRDASWWRQVIGNTK
jgi:hypothetical protein